VVTYRFRLDFDRRRWWLTLPLEVGGAITFDLVLDTGSPLSGISERVRDALLGTPYLGHLGAGRYRLRDLQIRGQPMPDLEVGISRRATEVGVDGVLGLAFFAQFVDVCINIPTLELTLQG
jgi:hypothetical protein